MSAERWLRLILRVTGTALLGALPFVFVPRTWHAAVHEWLGFGPYPDGPVIDYLARSVSAMYVLSGVFCWLVAADVRRWGPMIQFLGWASVGFGAVMTVVDGLLGLPWWWFWGEGPPAVVLGAVLVVLARAVGRTAGPEAGT